MDVLVLRLIHIGAGVFWVGAFVTFFLFVQPAAMAVGPDAAKFNYRLLHYQRFGVTLLASAVTTVLAGIWLLGIASNGFDLDQLFSPSRLGFTVGGVAAILTLGVGGLYVFPRTVTVERTLGHFLGEGRPPTPEEGATIAKAGGEARRAGWIVLVGLTIAVVAMATARYWSVVIG